LGEPNSAGVVAVLRSATSAHTPMDTPLSENFTLGLTHRHSEPRPPPPGKREPQIQPSLQNGKFKKEKGTERKGQKRKATDSIYPLFPIRSEAKSDTNLEKKREEKPRLPLEKVSSGDGGDPNLLFPRTACRLGPVFQLRFRRSPLTESLARFILPFDSKLEPPFPPPKGQTRCARVGQFMAIHNHPLLEHSVELPKHLPLGKMVVSLDVGYCPLRCEHLRFEADEGRNRP